MAMTSQLLPVKSYKMSSLSESETMILVPEGMTTMSVTHGNLPASSCRGEICISQHLLPPPLPWAFFTVSTLHLPISPSLWISPLYPPPPNLSFPLDFPFSFFSLSLFSLFSGSSLSPLATYLAPSLSPTPLFPLTPPFPSLWIPPLLFLFFYPSFPGSSLSPLLPT